MLIIAPFLSVCCGLSSPASSLAFVLFGGFVLDVFMSLLLFIIIIKIDTCRIGVFVCGLLN